MERVEVHPIFDRFCYANDHYDGELAELGDALGKDCMIAAFLPEALDFARLYRGDGKRNEDWFSYDARVYAPISGRVTKIYINPVTNQPGVQNPSPASCMTIKAEDGLNVWVGHIQSPVVSEGEQVTEGQHLAYVGNNGYARNPHIHLGAYRDGKPLAISFDPQKVGKVAVRVGECHWLFGMSEQEYLDKYQK